MPDNNQPRDVFISYSRKNKADVLPIKDEIERSLGLKCWIDLSDIPCGTENFKKKVIPGIRQTRLAFLFFLSTESQASENAMKEIEFARKRAGKRVILVRFNDDEMTDEFAFDYLNADIIDWRVPEQKDKLLHDLREWADDEGVPDAKKTRDGTKENGDGSVQQSGNSVLAQSPVKSEKAPQASAGKKTSILGAGDRMNDCATYIQQAYQVNGYDSQMIRFEENGAAGVLVQIKSTNNVRGGWWQSLTGTGLCATLKLVADGDNLNVEVMASRWLDKAAAVASWFCKGGVLVAAVGVYRQKALLDKVFNDAVTWLSIKTGKG